MRVEVANETRHYVPHDGGTEETESVHGPRGSWKIECTPAHDPARPFCKRHTVAASASSKASSERVGDGEREQYPPLEG
ncbi:hypothetical protein TPADAL_0814b [Treponema pallidum subsp. pallidum DAL-1]|uniref:Uncharacterized protein n=2 Tax=Treponema pallidum TaxID=160 RepID=A0AAU8RNG6_TREPL|nr:hypothetical protein TPESAMD_0814b [Treponema pallidum subsp. pertenue str. SamoaD]AEZ59014.1 hypothetical protein TPECDC2_0814b [Treponema pallidum subsp. pertenue str. CDC2]AEZ60082.1 hypothetical protein TPEGAU_0814b [Treponema pallidum subsp. pertenue str. Gauthier]AEZ61142.1 hypothetical protein TPADAL_0814b [Treponema pallidum subsp. pallidum DAL-1]AGK84466.1 hypothetical protein TPFB_0814b [Treponema pallidum str. Fribourg-Blanc]AJB40842.1 hypothetical protein TENDBA_0814b [Treponema